MCLIPCLAIATGLYELCYKEHEVKVCATTSHGYFLLCVVLYPLIKYLLPKLLKFCFNLGKRIGSRILDIVYSSYFIIFGAIQVFTEENRPGEKLSGVVIIFSGIILGLFIFYIRRYLKNSTLSNERILVSGEFILPQLLFNPENKTMEDSS